MKTLKYTSQFKKDLKKYQNKPAKLAKLKTVLTMIEKDIAIPAEYKPHRLVGNYVGCMECHIENDTLLIWIDESVQEVKLVRLGSHSELFD